MTIKDWTASTFPTTQDADPITGTMPDLDDETAPGADDGDEVRSTHVEVSRDKLQAVCKEVGDLSDNPAGCLRERVATLEAAGTTDPDAIHDNVAAEISAVSEKTSPVAGDWLLAEDSESGDAKVKVQMGNLPISYGPGEMTIVSDGQPAATIGIAGSGDTQIIPETGGGLAFAVRGGEYLVAFSAQFYAVTSGTSIQVKLVIDEGEAYEQTIGYSEQWQTRIVTIQDYVIPTFWETIPLTPGSHTVKAYAKEIGAGGTAQILGTASVPVMAPVVTFQLLSGSGVGGTIGDSAVKASDQVIASGAWTKITGLDLSVDALAYEMVDIGYQVFIENPTAGTRGIAYRIGGGSWIVLTREYGQYGMSFEGSLPVQLSSGSNTIEFGFYASAGSATVHGTGGTPFGTLDTESKTWATQHRGGVVQASSLDLIDEPSTGSPTTVSGSFVDIAAEFEQTVDIPSTGRYRIQMNLCAFATGSSAGVRWALLVDGTPVTPDTVKMDLSMATSAGQQERGTFSCLVDLTAGPRTFKLQWKRSYGSGTVNLNTSSHLHVMATLG